MPFFLSCDALFWEFSKSYVKRISIKKTLLFVFALKKYQYLLKRSIFVAKYDQFGQTFI